MHQPPPVPTPPRNTREARSVVDGLLADGARFGGALRALEAHPGYRRLGTTVTAGATMLAWERVRTTMDELAVQLRAYQAMLARAQAMVASRARLSRVELAELTRVLNEPVDVPMSAPAVAQSRNVADLIAHMIQVHDRLLRNVTTIEDCAVRVQRRLNQLSEGLRALGATAAALPFRDDGAVSLVDRLACELAELTPTVLADPLGCSNATDRSQAALQDRLQRLNAAIDEAHTYLSTLRSEQTELRQSIGRLREQVEEVKMAEQECHRIEGEVRMRIATPVLDEAEDEDVAASLRLQLDALERLRMEGLWPRLAELFREVGQSCADAVERARGRQAVAQALLDERDDLRGRLDSYRAMASRYGYAEDLALANQYEDTHRLLWTAPCDLHEARASLTRYQAAVIERTGPRRRDRAPDPGVETSQ